VLAVTTTARAFAVGTGEKLVIAKREAFTHDAHFESIHCCMKGLPLKELSRHALASKLKATDKVIFSC
jgi:hypothetical protein